MLLASLSPEKILCATMIQLHEGHARLLCFALETRNEIVYTSYIDFLYGEERARIYAYMYNSVATLLKLALFVN